MTLESRRNSVRRSCEGRVRTEYYLPWLHLCSHAIVQTVHTQSFVSDRTAHTAYTAVIQQTTLHVHAVPASSGGVERFFSKVARNRTQSRKRTSVETISDILFGTNVHPKKKR